MEIKPGPDGKRKFFIVGDGRALCVICVNLGVKPLNGDQITMAFETVN
jgi:hypothetical protein